MQLSPIARDENGKGKAREDSGNIRGQTKVKSKKKQSRVVLSEVDSDSACSSKGSDDGFSAPKKVGRRKKQVIEDEKPRPKARRNKPKPQEFPMTMESMDVVSPPSSVASSKCGKRSSEGGNDDDRLSKKSRQELQEYVCFSTTNPSLTYFRQLGSITQF